ncbi:hypothetical protein IQ269_00805 [Tychonema sp. LEGE 07199]|uniref:hypothetical protein n=1 Tax=unclassified Tychonema TaxID=2642144 RepID=UPI001880E8E7|nr:MULTISPECIES: hypothetical protein [unclassified Tychonema]MBE9119381.1 hypothetical protein [Tychonema sp. LEGE 07199]MBE9130532.1 hypothetical protein [Tychonema sp. LEGE 07196]
MRTLIQLTTTATLAVCLQVNTIGIANAATITKMVRSADFSPQQVSGRQDALRTNPRSTSTFLVAAETSRSGNTSKYEPDPNGNPKSDGTGTR